MFQELLEARLFDPQLERLSISNQSFAQVSYQYSIVVCGVRRIELRDNANRNSVFLRLDCTGKTAKRWPEC